MIRVKVASFIDAQKWQRPRETTNAAVTVAWTDAQHESDIKDAIVNMTQPQITDERH